jgi:hypothetical protein
VGLEVGWHIRFTKAREIDILADLGTRPQLDVIIGTYPGWRLESEDRGDHLFYHLTRG